MADRSGSSSVVASQQVALAISPSSKAALELQEMVAMVETRKGERKVKTEENRRETVKLLEERRVRNEEEKRFKLFRLPDSVWQQILTEVKDPKDLGSMWGVHPKFRDLSGESQSLEYLLSKILSIEKLPHLWKDEFERTPKLKMFRTLSNGMRTSVDRLLDEEFIKRLRSHEGYQPRHEFRVDDHLEEGEFFAKNLAMFSEGPAENQAKRVLYRAIQVIYTLRQDRWLGLQRFREFRNHVTSVLQRVGDQIWYFNFSIDDKFKDIVKRAVPMNEVYICFHEWVSLMPNLKMLGLGLYVDINGKNAMISPETLENYPFPHLNQLERVLFDEGFPNVMTKVAIAAAVIQSNLQIKALDLTGFDVCDKKASDRVCLTKMKPLLSKLNLGMLGGRYQWTPPELEIMRPLVCNKWMLKHFKGSLQGSSDLGEFFKFVNQIKTLEHLSLHVRGLILGEGGLQPVSLPNLKFFKMYASIDSVNYKNVGKVLSFTSLRFLFTCEKLKTLDWTFAALEFDSKKKFYELMDQHEESQMIKFKCGYQDVTKWNLWDVFPLLEYVKVDTCIWSEDAHESKKRKVRKSKLL